MGWRKGAGYHFWRQRPRSTTTATMRGKRWLEGKARGCTDKEDIPRSHFNETPPQACVVGAGGG